jgi:hypothetical protein
VAQRRFSATGDRYERACLDDNRQLNEMAKKLAKSPRDVGRLVEAVNVQAEKLVKRYWKDIEFIGARAAPARRPHQPG